MSLSRRCTLPVCIWDHPQGIAELEGRVQVPGEMFALAMEAKKRGMGVVGSTQNILDFIAAKLKDAVERPFPDTLQVKPEWTPMCMDLLTSISCRCGLKSATQLRQSGNLLLLKYVLAVHMST